MPAQPKVEGILIMTTEQIAELKRIALEKHREAEKAMYNYAKECNGIERMEAFEVYENIRTATRVR